MLSWPGFYFEPCWTASKPPASSRLLVRSWNPTFDLQAGWKKRSAKLYIIVISATKRNQSAWFLWPCVGVSLTRCRRQHIRGVPEPHEIKLVKPPVFLVRSGHWVLPPLVHNLVSRVAVWEPHRGLGCGRKREERQGKVEDCTKVFIVWMIYTNLYSKFSSTTQRPADQLTFSS